MVVASAPVDPLDLPGWLGQRALTYTFEVVNGLTGRRKGRLSPLRSSAPTLAHDTTSIISRRVNGLVIDADDAVNLDPLVDRIEIAMIVGGRTHTTYPLGRYLVVDDPVAETTSGGTTTLTLFDEMFVVDQELETGIDAGGRPVDLAIGNLLEGLPIGDVMIEATTEVSSNSWTAGTSRGSALADLATLGGYLKPWFDHRGRLRVVQAFDPSDRAPAIDLDVTGRVLRSSLSRSSEILNAPNRFVVISNDLGDGGTAAVVGRWDVPATAPHSISRRGIVLPKVIEVQVPTARQAQLYARTFGLQAAVYEMVELSTVPDPRHDGYDVIRWNGQLWLEIGWEMPLTPGGEMRHTLRRAYPGAEGES